MRRALFLVVVLSGVVALAGQVVWHTAPAQQPAAPVAQAARAADAPLPIAQVVLFSSGVGYFQREGKWTGYPP